MKNNNWLLILVFLLLLVATGGFAFALNVNSFISPDPALSSDNLLGYCNISGNQSTYDVEGRWYKNGLLYDIDILSSFSNAGYIDTGSNQITLDIYEDKEQGYIFAGVAEQRLRIYNATTYASISAPVDYVGVGYSGAVTEDSLYIVTAIGGFKFIRIYNRTGNTFDYWKTEAPPCGSNNFIPVKLRAYDDNYLWFRDVTGDDGGNSCLITLNPDGDFASGTSLYTIGGTHASIEDDDDYVVISYGTKAIVYNKTNGNWLRNITMSASSNSYGVHDGQIYTTGYAYDLATGNETANWTLSSSYNHIDADENYIYAGYISGLTTFRAYWNVFDRDDFSLVYTTDYLLGNDVGAGRTFTATTAGRIFMGTQDSFFTAITRADTLINNGTATQVGFINASETSFGDNITFECVVDGLSGFDSVIVVNESEILSVGWNVSSVDNLSSLYGFCSGVDKNASNFTLYARSYRDDVLVSTNSLVVDNFANVSVINESNLNGGEEWILSCGLNRTEFVLVNETVNGTNVTVNQSVNVTYWWNSSSVLVTFNPVPVVTDVILTDLVSSLFCGYTYNDTEAQDSESFLWYVNDSLVGGESSQNLSSSNYGFNDYVRCSVWTNNTIGQESEWVNSSAYYFGDSTPPVISGVDIPSTAQVDTNVDLDVDCSDAIGEVATSYPKVSFVSPSNVTLGNFTMPSLGGDSYRRTYVFTELGNYTGFTFYCKDGSGNLAVFNYTGVLQITEAPVIPNGTGGGGGGEVVEKPVCDISLSPEQLRITQPNELFEVVIRNDELSSYDPTFSFVLGDDVGFSVSRLQISNPVVSLLPSQSASFGVQFVGNETEGGSVTLVLSSSNCADIALPITVDFSGGGLLIFTELFGEGFSLSELFGLSVFPDDSKLTELGFNFAWLFGILFVLWGILFVVQAVKSVSDNKVGRAFIWLLVWLLVTFITSLIFLVVFRGGV